MRKDKAGKAGPFAALALTLTMIFPFISCIPAAQEPAAISELGAEELEEAQERIGQPIPLPQRRDGSPRKRRDILGQYEKQNMAC